MPLTKRERFEIAEMLDILNDLRFVGIEREIRLEDLQERAKELLQHSLFRGMIPELLQGGLDVEEGDEDMSAYEALIGLARSFPDLKPLLKHSFPSRAGEWKGLDDLIKPGYVEEDEE